MTSFERPCRQNASFIGGSCTYDQRYRASSGPEQLLCQNQFRLSAPHGEGVFHVKPQQ
jgi:hypothetical protein